MFYKSLSSKHAGCKKVKQVWKSYKKVEFEIPKTHKIVRKEDLQTTTSYQSMYTILSNDKINCLVCNKYI